MNPPIDATGNVAESAGRHPGRQYLDWCHYEEKHLTPEQKARAEDQFADMFAVMPAVREPWSGWGLLMSELCRRAARVHRGLEVGEWPHAMPKPVDVERGQAQPATANPGGDRLDADGAQTFLLVDAADQARCYCLGVTADIGVRTVHLDPHRGAPVFGWYRSMDEAHHQVGALLRAYTALALRVREPDGADGIQGFSEEVVLAKPVLSGVDASPPVSIHR